MLLARPGRWLGDREFLAWFDGLRQWARDVLAALKRIRDGFVARIGVTFAHFEAL